MNKTNTKRALFLSLVSLLLCFSMMLGTTFAWFTDNVTIENNRIVAGNLDVELFYKNGNMTDFANAMTAGAKMFVDSEGNDILWEPGVVAYTNFQIKNVGNLALKYAMNAVVKDETTTTVDGVELSLQDVIKVAVLPEDTVDSREEAIAKATASGIRFDEIATNGDLLPAGNILNEKEYDECAVILYWAPNADDIDNKYNLNNDRRVDDSNALDIVFDITLVASQLTHEDDSFGNDYDAGASWVGSTNIDWYLDDPDATEFTISTAEELAGLASIVNGTAVNPVSTLAAGTTATTITDDFKGDTIYLGADIDLADALWTPIGNDANVFRANFDGQGHTIYNLKVNNDGWSGLIGHAGKGHAVTISNLNIVGATINSNRMAGAIVGQLYGNIDKCTVTDAYIKVVPNAVDGGYDNGDKVGGIVGWIGDNNNNRTLTNCSANNIVLSAYRDVGGIAGYVAWSTTIANNSVSGIDITIDQITNHYGEKDANAGAVWGRNSVSGTGVGVTADNNTEADVSIAKSYIKDGVQLKADAEGDVVLYLVPSELEEDTIEVPEGVTTIGGYAFAYNTNVDKIVLPSTVTTLNDRAFRDTSASTVVLNEGLENISYQAFRNALNVTEVEIPSTVKTISKEAFQNSGIKTLTVPADVTTIEYGAMRDMKQLVSVTIESDADIPVYAFRACTNLKTVIITSEDVTFGGGSRGMIFTNTESGDGSAITIYVASEEVKARLIAADTAAKDYGGYKIVVISEDSVLADTAEDVVEAVKNGENVIMTDDVTAPLSQSAIYGTPVAIIQKNGGVIDGGGNSLIIESPKYNGYAIETYGGTIKNLTIDTEVGRGIVISSPKEDIYIDNVVIDGPGYAINTTEHQARNLYITNSTVNGWTSLAGLTQVTFTDCRLGENNAKYWQNMGYDQDYDRLIRPYVTATFEDCEFEQGYYIDLSALGADCTVTLDNCNTNGTVITEENYASYITIELPAGRTLADCVVFA